MSRCKIIIRIATPAQLDGTLKFIKLFRTSTSDVFIMNRTSVELTKHPVNRKRRRLFSLSNKPDSAIFVTIESDQNKHWIISEKNIKFLFYDKVFFYYGFVLFIDRKEGCQNWNFVWIVHLSEHQWKVL